MATYAGLDPGAINTLRSTFPTDAELADILSEFVTNCRAISDDVERGLRSGDLGEVARCAHNAKSMARLVGAQALASSSLRLERVAAGGRSVPDEVLAPFRQDLLDAASAAHRLAVAFAPA